MSLVSDQDYFIQKLRLAAFKNPDCRKLSTFLDFNTNQYTSTLPLPDDLPESPVIPINIEPLKLEDDNEKEGIEVNDTAPIANVQHSVETPVSLHEEDFSELIKKETVERKESESALSKLLNTKGKNKNPFAEEYSGYSGVGVSESITLKIWIPFIPAESKKPIKLTVKKTANVEAVIGFILYQYVEEKRTELPVKNAASYTLRIVEDDGTIDEDFPDSFKSFHLTNSPCVLTKSVRRSHSETVESKGKFFIKIHVYSTLEVKQTTTLSVVLTMKASHVLEEVCKKRKLKMDDYTLKMADTKTDIPMDKTLEQLQVAELCLLRKDRGVSAGDIFLRPPDEIIEDSEPPAFINTNEYSASNYKKYLLKKLAMFGGRTERVLAIDGDYLHLLPAENKSFFDSVKTTSYHVSSVISCEQIHKNSKQFRLEVGKNGELKGYDFEAQSVAECSKRILFS